MHRRVQTLYKKQRKMTNRNFLLIVIVLHDLSDLIELIRIRGDAGEESYRERQKLLYENHLR